MVARRRVASPARPAAKTGPAPRTASPARGSTREPRKARGSAAHGAARRGLRIRAGQLVHHAWTHRAISVLLSLDMVLVASGGVLESQFLASQLSACQTEVAHYHNYWVEHAPTEEADGFAVARIGKAQDGPAERCDGAQDGWDELHHPRQFPKWRPPTAQHLHFGDDRLHHLETLLAHASLAILLIFAVEQCLLIVAEGWRFFTNPYYLLDLGVISLSIVLELVALRPTATPVGLICARAWRFGRVGHGVFESTRTGKGHHGAFD